VKGLAKGRVENLINQSMRTKEEQRKIAVMGGKASGEARRRKKTLRETLITLLNAENYEIDGQKVDGYVATALALIKKATKGDVHAITALRDTVGEKPREELEVSVQKKLEDFL
jgi:phage terminase large subunit